MGGFPKLNELTPFLRLSNLGDNPNNTLLARSGAVGVWKENQKDKGRPSQAAHVLRAKNALPFELLNAFFPARSLNHE